MSGGGDWSDQEPSAWYEHEVDESDYPKPPAASRLAQHASGNNASTTGAGSGIISHAPNHTHSMHHQHHTSHSQHSQHVHLPHHHGGGGMRGSQSVRERDREQREREREMDHRDHREREYGGGGGRMDRDRDHHHPHNRHAAAREREREQRERERDLRERREREREEQQRREAAAAAAAAAAQQQAQQYEESFAADADSDDDDDDSCPLCMEQLDATDKQFMPCKCGYQVCLWCFPAGTPITLANGMSRPIDALTQGGELLLAYDAPDSGVDAADARSTGLVHARSQQLIRQGEKELVELQLEDGSTLRCTHDHRLLVTDTRTGEMRWCSASDIDLQHQRVRTTVRGPLLDEMVEKDSDWSLECTALPSFDLLTEPARQRSLTLARVSGFVCRAADSGMVEFVSSFDAVAFREDLAILTGDAHQCAAAHSSTVMLPHAVAAAMPPASVPPFLLEANCPRQMKREFVAAYISAAATIATTTTANSSATAPLTSDYSGLSLPLLPADLHLLSPLLQALDTIVAPTLDTATSLRFAEKVGLRYAHLLASRLAIAVSFWRFSAMRHTEVLPLAFDEYLARVDAKQCFDDAAAQSARQPTYSQGIVSRVALTTGPEAVYDLMVLSSSKSASIHSFIAGGVVAHNCFHHINENLSGKCPACRRTYDTTGQMAADPAVLETMAVKAASGGVRRGRDANTGGSGGAGNNSGNNSGSANTGNSGGNNPAVRARGDVDRRRATGSVPPAHVRVLQRNLLYVVGLPVQLAKDELLRSRPYFGKFGKIIKIALGLKGGGASSDRKQTCSCYVTYKRGVDAVEAIKAVNGSILLGCLLKATYGTSKYCANWLRGSPCNNPTCLYLHETADPKDCTTKDELSAFLQETQPSTVNPQAISVNGLPGATSNSMLHGSSSGLSQMSMSRAASVGSVAIDRDEDDYEKATPTVAAAPPSSWASLAGSRTAASETPKQVVPAPIEHSPASEVLMPNEIIYIAPPHLRSTTGGSNSGASNQSSQSQSQPQQSPSSQAQSQQPPPQQQRKMGSRSSSNASSTAAPPTGLSDSTKSDTKDDSHAESGSGNTSPYVSPSAAAAVAVGPGPNTAADTPSPSPTSALTLQRSASTPLPPPVLSPPTPISVLAPLPSPPPSSTNVVGSRPPPGFFGAKPVTMPTIAPPAISQLQAPPGSTVPIGTKLAPGPMVPSPALPQSQPAPPAQAPAAPSVSLQSLISAFPAIDPQILALMVQMPLGQPTPINNHLLHPQPQHPQQQQPQSAQQSHPSAPSHSNPPSSSNGSLQHSHSSEPNLKALDPAIMSYSRSSRPPISQIQPHHAPPQQTQQQQSVNQQQQQQPESSFFQSMHSGYGAPSSGGNSGMQSLGGFSNTMPPSSNQYGQISRQQPSQSQPPPSQQQQQQPQPPQQPHLQSHDRLNDHSGPSRGGFHSNVPSDWESLVDDDRPLHLDSAPRNTGRDAHSHSSLAHNWSSWGKQLQDMEDDKQRQRLQAAQEEHHQQLRREKQQHQQAQQMMRERDPSQLWSTNPLPPSSSGGWQSQPLSRQQSQHDNGPSLSLNVSLHGASSSTTTPTSRYGFALEDDDDRIGGGSGSVSTTSSRDALRAFPPTQSTWSTKPSHLPAGIGGLNAGNPSNGWPTQNQTGPGGLLNDRDALALLNRDRPQPHSHHPSQSQQQQSQQPQYSSGGWPTRDSADEYGGGSLLSGGGAFAHHEYGLGTSFAAPNQPPQSNANQQTATRARAPLSVQNYMQQQRK